MSFTVSYEGRVFTCGVDEANELLGRPFQDAYYRLYQDVTGDETLLGDVIASSRTRGAWASLAKSVTTKPIEIGLRHRETGERHILRVRVRQ